LRLLALILELVLNNLADFLNRIIRARVFQLLFFSIIHLFPVSLEVIWSHTIDVLPFKIRRDYIVRIGWNFNLLRDFSLFRNRLVLLLIIFFDSVLIIKINLSSSKITYMSLALFKSIDLWSNFLIDFANKLLKVCESSLLSIKWGIIVRRYAILCFIAITSLI
jgi:hypothetical protein